MFGDQSPFDIIKRVSMNSTLQPGSIAAASKAGTSPSEAGVAREFEALISGCGIYDLGSRAKIRLTGSDRVRWLNGMVTNNIRDLAVNRGVYCFLLNAQGHIQADLYAYHIGESLLVDTAAELRDKVLAHFDKFIIMDDVEVADVTGTTAAIGLGGPRARAVMRAAGIEMPELAPLELCTPKCDCDCGCLACTLVRGDEAMGESYEIWLAPEQMKTAWDALVAAGATAVGREALELWRIGRGVPAYGVDIRERDLPQETGQMRALSFTKGCYLGQEIVERIRSRGAVHREFRAFEVEGSLPAPGTKIQADEKEVGEITSGAELPVAAGSRSIALGYLRREAAAKNLRAGTAKLKPASLPII